MTTAEANARLIAAAPELYEALNAILASFQYRCEFFGDTTESEREDIARARAALAKVTP